MAVNNEVLDRSKDGKPPPSSILIAGELKNGWILLMRPVENFLIENKIHPNILTVTSLITSAGVGLLFHFNLLFFAGIILIAGSTFDMLDGRVARALGLSSNYGAFFDSSLDRVAEIFIYLGLLSHFHADIFAYVVFLILASTTMVSYTRARAEGLGIDCTVGIMQRTERIVFLGVGAVYNFAGNLITTGFDIALSDVILKLSLLVILLFSTVTFIQRIVYVLGAIKSDEGNSEDTPA